MRLLHLLDGLDQLLPVLLQLPGTLDRQVARAHVGTFLFEAPKENSICLVENKLYKETNNFTI